MVATFLDRAISYGDQLRSSVQLATDQAGQTFIPTPDRYALNEAYYANAAYEQRSRATLNRLNLPRNIRSVLALIKPAVDWWPAHLYPGVWTKDGYPATNGRDNRIAYDVGTPDEIRVAAQTAFLWGGWDKDLLTYALQGAMLGDAFANVKIDWERGKVYPMLHHPRYVREIEFNDSGDVTMYRLSIPQRDDNGHAYRYGLRVDKETFRTYLDDEPHSYDGQPAVIDNPWGFVPAVWVQHRNVGGQHGGSVMDGLHPIIDELNGMQSAIDDYVMRFVRQQIVVGSDDPKGLARFLTAGTYASPKPGPAAPAPNDYDDFLSDAAHRRFGERHDDDLSILPAPSGTTVGRLLTNLGVGESSVHFDRILEVLERNIPELILTEKLLNMTRVTGPGVRPLIMDVQHKLDDAAANYDGGVVKLVQMCCSIGGHLANAGVWGANRRGLSAQQQTFLPFDITSFDKGDLDFSIQPRDLLRPATLDLANEAKIIESLRTPFGLQHVGLGPEEIYGVDANGNVNPHTDNGILADLQSGQNSTAATFGRLFNAGQ